MDPLIITIDGPAGSGKSTVARLLAARLGLDFLDTGAMYRGLTVALHDAGIDPVADPDRAIAHMQATKLDFDWSQDPPRLLVDGVDCSQRIRDPHLSGLVSEVAAMGPVRDRLVLQQQQIGQAHPRLVTEGRDQGSVVFPDARVKFYLDASVDVRVQRRAEQLEAQGKTVDRAWLDQQIRHRDFKDSHRTQAPLSCPADAIRVDTSDLTLEEVVQTLVDHVIDRVPAAGRGPRHE